MRLIIFTQNTMASTVATRIVVQKCHEHIAAIMIADELGSETLLQKIKTVKKLIDRSSWGFFFYKVIETQLYPVIIKLHKIFRSTARKKGAAYSITEVAHQYNIPVKKVNSLSDPELLKEIQQLEPDYIFSVVGQILKPNVFNSLPKKILNAHGSYLPEYRGPAQYIWYLLNNDTEYGVTLHFMTPEIDAGDILLQKKYPLPSALSAYRVHYLLATQFGNIMHELIEQHTKKITISTTVQDSQLVSITRLPTTKDMKRFHEAGNKLFTWQDIWHCT